MGQYTKQYNNDSGLWHIYTPDGETELAWMQTEEEADTLLSHLNR